MKTQGMFSLLVVTEDGCVVFDCSKVNFLVALKLEYLVFIWGNPGSLMSDGEGNRLDGDGEGRAWWEGVYV